MFKKQQCLKKWGNSLGVHLPIELINTVHLSEGQQVYLRSIKGNIVISPITKKKRSLADRLENFDPSKHSGEVMQTTARLGSEK